MLRTVRTKHFALAALVVAAALTAALSAYTSAARGTPAPTVPARAATAPNAGAGDG